MQLKGKGLPKGLETALFQKENNIVIKCSKIVLLASQKNFIL
jgi:hypothetical protein